MNPSTTTPLSVQRRDVTIGVVLLTVGLAGHLIAAHLNGGSATAYRHHLLGFLGLAAISGIVLPLLGKLLWPSRYGLTVLLIGAVQAAFGLLVVYLERGAA